MAKKTSYSAFPKNVREKNRRTVQIAMIIAIMIVLQVLAASLVRISITCPSLVLIPLFIGSASFGKKCGALLGGVFGAVTLILGITGFDLYTNGLFLYKPVETVIICLGKGILAGFLSAVVYEALMKATHGKLFPSSLIASAVTPIVNTGLYVLGVFFFFKSYSGFAENDSFFVVIWAVILGVLFNFILELALNLICCPALSVSLSKIASFKKLLLKN